MSVAVCRSAYIACSDPGARQPAFDFVKHMLLCLERDASRIVGLSLEMWLVVIVWVLLSGLVSECRSRLADCTLVVAWD